MRTFVLFLTTMAATCYGQLQRSTFNSPHASYSTEYGLGGGHYHYPRYHSPYHSHSHYNPLHAPHHPLHPPHHSLHYNDYHGHHHSYPHYNSINHHSHLNHNRIHHQSIRPIMQSPSPSNSLIRSNQISSSPIPSSNPQSTSFSSPSSPSYPYSYSYGINDVDSSHSRSESSDGNGHVRGEYSINLADGRRRLVQYTADHTGFHANVRTNEPGTESQSPADTQFTSSAIPGPQAALLADPHHHHHHPRAHYHP